MRTSENRLGRFYALLVFAAAAVVFCCACRQEANGALPATEAAAEISAGEDSVAAPVAPERAPLGQKYIHIDKQTMTLTLFGADGVPVARFGVATGINPGNKRRSGDMRTPEGHFRISQIQNASAWTHDFGDGRGQISGAYGPWFLRLEVPGFRGIGIHGTHDPASIGTRASEGCIRLLNENIDSLARMVSVGTPVIITPADADRNADNHRD